MGRGEWLLLDSGTFMREFLVDQSRNGLVLFLCDVHFTCSSSRSPATSRESPAPAGSYCCKLRAGLFWSLVAQSSVVCAGKMENVLSASHGVAAGSRGLGG